MDHTTTKLEIFIAPNARYLVNFVVDRYCRSGDVILCYENPCIKYSVIRSCVDRTGSFLFQTKHIFISQLPEFILRTLFELENVDLSKSSRAELFWALWLNKNHLTPHNRALSAYAELDRLEKNNRYYSKESPEDKAIKDSLSIMLDNDIWTILVDILKTTPLPKCINKRIVVVGIQFISEPMSKAFQILKEYVDITIFVSSTWILPDIAFKLEMEETSKMEVDMDSPLSTTLMFINNNDTNVSILPSIPFVAAQQLLDTVSSIPFSLDAPIMVFGDASLLNALQTSILFDLPVSLSFTDDDSLRIAVCKSDLHRICMIKNRIVFLLNQNVAPDDIMIVYTINTQLPLIRGVMSAAPYIPAFIPTMNIGSTNIYAKALLDILDIIKKQTCTIADLIALLQLPAICEILELSISESEYIILAIKQTADLFLDLNESTWELLLNHWMQEIVQNNNIWFSKAFQLHAAQMNDLDVLERIDAFVSLIKNGIADSRDCQSTDHWYDFLTHLIKQLFSPQHSSTSNHYVDLLLREIHQLFSFSTEQTISIEDVFCILHHSFYRDKTLPYSVTDKCVSHIRIINASMADKHLCAHVFFLDPDQEHEVDATTTPGIDNIKNRMANMILNTGSSLYICKTTENLSIWSSMFLALSKRISNDCLVKNMDHQVIKAHPVSLPSIHTTYNLLGGKPIDISVSTKMIVDALNGFADGLLFSLLNIKKPFVSDKRQSVLPSALWNSNPFDHKGLRYLWFCLMHAFKIAPHKHAHSHKFDAQMDAAIFSKIREVLLQHSIELIDNSLCKVSFIGNAICSDTPSLHNKMWHIHLPAHHMYGGNVSSLIETGLLVKDNGRIKPMIVCINIEKFVEIELSISSSNYTPSSLKRLRDLYNLDYHLLFSAITTGPIISRDILVISPNDSCTGFSFKLMSIKQPDTLSAIERVFTEALAVSATVDEVRSCIKLPNIKNKIPSFFSAIKAHEYTRKYI